MGCLLAKLWTIFRLNPPKAQVKLNFPSSIDFLFGVRGIRLYFWHCIEYKSQFLCIAWHSSMFAQHSSTDFIIFIASIPHICWSRALMHFSQQMDCVFYCVISVFALKNKSTLTLYMYAYICIYIFFAFLI